MSFGLPMGVALASGLNTYLPLLALALFARLSHVVHLAPRFQWLISDQAIVILAILAACEVLADKVPGLDNVWDFIHTLLRPVAGALAAGATLSTNHVFEILLVMLTGATLATAAHSAKSGVRLVSTTKGFGIANPFLSLTEDVAAVLGTLLAVYTPWLMLAIVILFVAAFALLGPPLFRMLRFDLSVLLGWFRWIGRKATGVADPRDLKESLLELRGSITGNLTQNLEAGEEILGALRGWRRSGWGPRRTWLLVTPRRLILAEARMLRGHKVESFAYPGLLLMRNRASLLVSRVEFVTRENQSVTILLPKTHAALAALATAVVQTFAALTPGDTPSKSAKLMTAVS